VPQPASGLSQLLDTIEDVYGVQKPVWPTDPYRSLVWWHCGYPPSDAACAKGWESLNREIGVAPDQLLSAGRSKIALALKAGGMVPELRATRLQEIAERVVREFAGDLAGALNELPLAQARAALKKFPCIANPGADRLLLFGGISPVAAVPSNCPQVLVRIERGWECENYGVTYDEAQRTIESEVPVAFDARMRAYLLLKCHGQQVCKRANPKCSSCPVATSCAYFARNKRGPAVPEARQK
jgi:endonuclease-3